jgi:hypothetical protein
MKEDEMVGACDTRVRYENCLEYIYIFLDNPDGRDHLAG